MPRMQSRLLLVAALVFPSHGFESPVISRAAPGAYKGPNWRSSPSRTWRTVAPLLLESEESKPLSASEESKQQRRVPSPNSAERDSLYTTPKLEFDAVTITALLGAAIAFQFFVLANL